MRNREIQVKVYFNNQEKKKLDLLCRQTGLKPSLVIRYLVLGYEPPEAPHVKYDDLIYQLRCIGNNINQILRIARMNGILNPAELEKHLSELKDVEQEMHDAFRINRKN